MPYITHWWQPNESWSAPNTLTRNPQFMKTNQPTDKKEESTYSLLMRSEEKKRTFIEVVVYGLVILSVLAAIWGFANEFFWFPA